MDYRAVCGILDELAESRAFIVEPDARVLITHYTEMLRRHIVGDSEIARLAQQIYRKHGRAIDLIYKHRFANQEAIREMLINLVEETPRLVNLGRSSGLPTEEHQKFAVQEWDVPGLQTGDDYKVGNRLLVFWFGNWPESVRLSLSIMSGDTETRHKLLSVAHASPTVFKDAREELNRGWTAIFRRAILTPEFYEQSSYADREREIHKQWADFLENDLPRIDAALKQER